MSTGLAKEAKILEYWRKRYLAQAVVVALLAIAAMIAASAYADYWLLKVLLCMLVFMVAYIMVKALREGLQARGEGLVLAKGEELFGEVMFDVGRGLCENALLVQEIAPKYQVRECRNVMRGKGWWFEEDWFYSVISSKYIPVNQTAFEGVILAFADIKSEDRLKGNIRLKNNQAVITGGLAPRLKQTKAGETAVNLLRLFNASTAELAVADKTLYIWITTEKKLFYQFSLMKPNTPTQFQKRIERLKELSEHMLTELNG